MARNDPLSARLEDPSTREKALRELAKSRRTDAALVAARFLDDANEFVRFEALNYLIHHGSRRLRHQVEKLLGDKSDLVRVASIECLAVWGVKGASGRIAVHLQDRAPLVRAYAGWAVGRLGARPSIPELTRIIRERPLARHFCG